MTVAVAESPVTGTSFSDPLKKVEYAAQNLSEPLVTKLNALQVKGAGDDRMWMVNPEFLSTHREQGVSLLCAHII
jgi:hypothetical protein